MHEVNASLDKMGRTLPAAEQGKFREFRETLNDQMRDRLAGARHKDQLAKIEGQVRQHEAQPIKPDPEKEAVKQKAKSPDQKKDRDKTKGKDFER